MQGAACSFVCQALDKGDTKVDKDKHSQARHAKNREGEKEKERAGESVECVEGDGQWATASGSNVNVKFVDSFVHQPVLQAELANCQMQPQQQQQQQHELIPQQQVEVC